MSNEPLSLAEVEKQHVLKVCELHHWNKASAAATLGLSVDTLYSKLRKWGVTTKAPRKDSGKPHKSTYHADLRRVRDLKVAELVERFKAGENLVELGKAFGVTRERIRQLLKTRGVTGLDGGRHVAATRRHAAKYEERNARFLAKYGMSIPEYEVVSRYLGPTGAPAKRSYIEQKRNAIDHGLQWAMTFGEWWSVWQASGKWELRGVGAGAYWMARKNNEGVYAVDNVEIVEAGAFISFVRQKKREARQAQR